MHQIVAQSEVIGKNWVVQDLGVIPSHDRRTTLGDYLRGPQQNLGFLLPLVLPKSGDDHAADRSDFAGQGDGAVILRSDKMAV